MIIELGEFENNSGVMLMTDPCYIEDTWCARSEPCKKDKWAASVVKKTIQGWGERVLELQATAHGFSPGVEWDNCGTLGVDSGQLGFFDKESYREKFMATASDVNKISDEVEWANDLFYKLCCSLTLDKERAGVFSTGVVSSSGFGDGGYALLTQKDNSGVVAAIKVIFIEEEEG